MSQDDIEFVYFDLGNILVSFDPNTACRNVANEFGIEAAAVQAVIYDSGLQDQFEHGQVSGQQFANRVRAELNLSDQRMPTAALLDATSAMFTPIESMAETVESVASRGKRIGILSNTCHAHWDWILRQKWSVMNCGFEIQILSYEVGAMKPDARIYRAAEHAADVAPGKIFFLDDRSENVTGAIEQGWQAVQCVGGQPAHLALQRCGILP